MPCSIFGLEKTKLKENLQTASDTKDIKKDQKTVAIV